MQFKNVTKRFGGFVAVDNLDLDIYEREFFALLGPSGCGKTTLMRMLAGFETPTEGEIIVDGENIVNVSPDKRPINMMFQSYALFPHMTVEQNVAFGLHRSGGAALWCEENCFQPHRPGQTCCENWLEKARGRKNK